MLISEKSGIELEARRKIYQYILKNPGLHKRELSRRLNIPKTTLTHHITYLEKHGHIAVNQEGRYTRFYVTENFGNLEKKIIHVLRQEISRNITLYIGWRVVASQAELSRELELSPKTIKKHLKKLTELGIIEHAPNKDGLIYTSHDDPKIVDRAQYGREVLYRLTKSKSANAHMGALLENILLTYKKGLGDNKVAKDVLYMSHFYRSAFKRRKIIESEKKGMEKAEKIFFEIFPHPYHV